MPEPFRSLASIFADAARARPDPTNPATAEISIETPDPAPHIVPVVAGITDGRIAELLDRFVADLARLRARAAECLEAEAEAVLADLAARVLARELCVAPAALEAMLDEALLDFDTNVHVVVRVSAADAERLEGGRTFAVDPTLRSGDFAIDVAEGRYEVALQTRLDAMLASHRVAL